MAVSVFLAESTLRSPMRSMLCRIWRCRLDSSTTSMSMMPMGAHAGGGEVERGGRAEATGAEQEHPGVEQLQLALDADLGQEEVALVAVALLGREHRRDLPVAALVLPLVEAAGHRDDVGVAELGRASWRRRRNGCHRRRRRRPARPCRAGGPRPGSRGCPRAMCTEPGMAPCSYSSGSRTSRTTAPVGFAGGFGLGGGDLSDAGPWSGSAARGSWASEHRPRRHFVVRGPGKA